MSGFLAILIIVGSFGVAPEGFAEDPRMGKGPARLMPANGLGSACQGELQLVSRALCFGRIAKARNDLSICDEADHPGVKNQCYYIYAKHTADLTVCERIPDRDLEDGCYSDLAALKDDPDICQRIVGQGIKDSCYFKIAKARPNHALCNRIEDQGLRSGCTGKAGAVK